MNIKEYIGRLLPDKLFISYRFYKLMGYKMNWHDPKTFNQKLQWLKIHNRNLEYTILVDKYEVKKYISNIIGRQYVIPTIGIWDKFDEINYNDLPSQFVLKCTHDSGGLVICQNKDKLDISATKKKIEQSLRNNYYWSGREWPYKDVKPRIIAEKYIGDNLRDYKLFCFNGIPRITLVCSERFMSSGLKEDFYDESWNHLDIQRPNHGNATSPIQCPNQYELMKTLAAELSRDIPFVRIDFYEVNGKVYFGEMTFYPASGFEGFIPEEWDMKLGEWLKLPSLKRIH